MNPPLLPPGGREGKTGDLGGFRSQIPSSSEEGTKVKNAAETSASSTSFPRKGIRRDGCIHAFRSRKTTIPGWKSSPGERSRHLGRARTPLLRERSSAPFGEVPGPPGALKEGDGLKAQWTSWLPSRRFPGFLTEPCQRQGTGLEGEGKTSPSITSE